jgi:dTDP-4-dehydrorhamnose 3,5-epimerase
MTTAPKDFEVRRTAIDGPFVILPQVHRDVRGFFQETYRLSTLHELGADCEWVQENHSRSVRGVLRGLHFQVGQGQAKLVRCARGAIRDVIVDIRRGSPTYGAWDAHDLSDENGALLYVPVGFAHGFCVTSDVADVLYSCSSYYDPELERGIAYDDPELGIDWPDMDHIVSERDTGARRLADVAEELPFEYAA